MDDIKTMYQKVKEIFTTEHHIDLDTDNMLTEQLFTDYISSQLEPQVSDANGGKIMEVLYEAEKYYKDLLETDYENRDYSACWVCQIKLQLLDELEFDIDSRLSR